MANRTRLFTKPQAKQSLKSLHLLPIRRRVTYTLATLVHNALMAALRGVLSSKRWPTSKNEISWQWEAPRTAHADFIWWQVVRRRWSMHLEQPTWCHPRFVSVILDIHKTVKTLFVCLTAAARVIFNWRLTNVLTNKLTNYSPSGILCDCVVVD